MNPLIIVLLALFAHAQLFGQKLVVEKSEVSFFSHAAIEDIKAQNNNSAGLFDLSSYDIAFSIPIQKFEFEKSLMQEHFNEKYMESDKFPKATFQGKVEGFDPASVTKQEAVAKGKLTIHGVTQQAEIPGTIERKDGKYTFQTKFIVKLADYKIQIPQLLWQNIAEQVEVSASFIFKPR